MKGEIQSINICREKGAKKNPVPKAILVARKGIKNDAHFATARQVSILSNESINRFVKKIKTPLKIKPGDFAENINTKGIDFSDADVGDTIFLGETKLQITAIGKKCHSGCRIQKISGYCLMPEVGLFAKVVRGGKIEIGDSVVLAKPIKIAVLTCSDKGSRGERIDTAGPAIFEELAKLKNIELNNCGYIVVPDSKKKISTALKLWADITKPDIIFTTGGTGFGPRDWTPEATREVMDRLCPGLPEYIRWQTFKKNKFAAISRATAGIRKKTLIINLPGSEKAVREIVKILLAIIPHSVEILRGQTEH